MRCTVHVAPFRLLCAEPQEDPLIVAGKSLHDIIEAGLAKARRARVHVLISEHIAAVIAHVLIRGDRRTQDVARSPCSRTERTHEVFFAGIIKVVFLARDR
jgi:hypothetical protein